MESEKVDSRVVAHLGGIHQAVDRSVMNDEDLWSRIDQIEAADPVLADVLRDMAGALHDTVTAPAIASNFESTPEQLLARLGV